MKKIISLLLELVIFMPIPIGAISDSPVDYLFEFVGSEEWKNAPRDVRLEMCQLTNEQLASFSTNELLNTLYKYPFMIDAFCYDDNEVGFEHVLSEFNGLQELLQRDDFIDTLLASYSSAEVVTANKAKKTLKIIIRKIRNYR